MVRSWIVLSSLCLGLAVVGGLTGCSKERTIFNGNDLSHDPGDGGAPPDDLVTVVTLDGPTLGIDAASDPNGPMITILTPTVDAEVQYDTIEVTANIVAPTGTSIDSSSVTLTVPGANNQNETAPMSLTAMPNVYKGQVSIAAIPPGKSEFSVSAKTVNNKQSTEIQSFVHDVGPVITFVQPTAKTAKGSIYVEILVDDKIHPITDPTKVKAGVRVLGDIALTQIAGAVPMRLSATIDFSQYSPPLDGEQLIVATATSDKGTIGRAQQNFIVDNLGPVITIVNPLAGQFIGGILEVKATLSDISDILDDSVTAVFANDPMYSVAMTRASPASSEFIGLFDVRQLGTRLVLPTLSIRAEDKLGNESEVAEVIVVDNEPPAISLDPPNIRVGKYETFKVSCSINFDPLGNGAFDVPDDGSIVDQVFSVRARVEDRGNRAPGLANERPSLIVPESVDLFAINATQGPLVVDTDGDGKCDAVNPLLVPSTSPSGSNEALAIRMVPVKPSGVADFLHSAGEPLAPGCDAMGIAGAVEPGPLCLYSGTRMTIAISYTTGKEPAIWSIPPVVQNDDACVGYQLDTLNRLAEGPACVTVRARDVAGNPGVAMPLRVCIQRDNASACNTFAGAMPNCTGTYDPVTNTVSSTPCTDAQPFPASGEIRLQ